MTTDVIYARVPRGLKVSADAYADQHGKTLAGAVAELLDRGLGALAEESAVDDLRSELARVTAEKIKIEAELFNAQAQLATLGSFAQRADQEVGTCPKCQKPISGRDLLAVGHCANCKRPLSSLIVPESGSSTLNQHELLLLVGALGAVLAVAYLSSRK